MSASFKDDLYALRRANGDWFALEDHEQLRVPLFHSSHDALMARLRNFGMLLFEPVALDTHLLATIAPGDRSDVNFWIVSDPFASLKRGRPIERAQIVSQLVNRDEHQPVPSNGNGFYRPGPSPFPQSEWWN
jgi:hypothetical protein